MCTAVSITSGEHYFGRNLDYEYDFGEQIVITPRQYTISFCNGKVMTNHYAMIGTAVQCEGYPLYFDAVNEKGLAMAGLNFPGLASYVKKENDIGDVASFELILWVLAQCETVQQAETLLSGCRITDEAFNEAMLPSPLHWIISDKEKSVTVEQTCKGFYLYDNPVGVLTNAPSFDMQMFYLSRFMSVTNQEPTNRFSPNIELVADSRGMGGLGLPGDLSSTSRFVKACFTAHNSVFGETEEEKVHQFFHILHSVFQQKGSVCVGEDYEMTQYTSCCNTCKGIYYYTMYYNSEIQAVDLFREDLESSRLIVYDMQKSCHIRLQN